MGEVHAHSPPQHATIDETIRAVSPLVQIESHEWSAGSWPTSERLLDGLEAQVSLARGRLLYEQFLRSGEGGSPAPGADGASALPCFRRAAELFFRIGDRLGEREAQFWVGTVEQVVRHDFPKAIQALNRSRILAEADGDRLVLSCVERHMGFIALLEGRFPAAESHLEASVRLRRSLGFDAGVAMGLIALAELQIERHDWTGARRTLDEAESSARASGLTGAMHSVELARRQLDEESRRSSAPASE